MNIVTEGAFVNYGLHSPSVTIGDSSLPEGAIKSLPPGGRWQGRALTEGESGHFTAKPYHDTSVSYHGKATSRAKPQILNTL